MKEVYLQYWEESERNIGVRPDGCSLHIDKQSNKNYINQIYANRDKEKIPMVYERIVDDVFLVKVKEEIYDVLIIDGTIRLLQYQMYNLIKMGELILC
jgi:hypothetical protein